MTENFRESACRSTDKSSSIELGYECELGTLIVQVSINGAGSDGRCNTLLIGWFNDTFHRGPISQAALIRSKQGAVFFETASADEFSL